MKAVDLLERNPAVWKVATRHPFLEAVGEGTFPAGTFEAWLAQDYLFVGDALVFQARLLARAPRPAQAVLAGGLVAIEAELGWFEEQAERLRIARRRMLALPGRRSGCWRSSSCTASTLRAGA